MTHTVTAARQPRSAHPQPKGSMIMSLKQVLDDVKKEIRSLIPPEVSITDIDFEGPEVVIYTKNIDAFTKSNELIRKLAQTLRKRIAIRPDPSLLVSIEEAEDAIRSIVPKDADIGEIYFNTDTGEVTVEAGSPGIAIGKGGSILNEIKRKIGWAPEVVRTPPIPSKTVKEIRIYLRQNADKRKAFLKKVGNRIYKEIPDGENWVRLTTLGGFREVGRSASLLQTRHSRALIDCGVNVSSNKPENISPYLSTPELMPLEKLDAVIVTHAHLDHSGLVPMLYKYGYEGPIYCTPPTRDLMSLLQLDYLRVAAGEGRKAPYESAHIREAVKSCITLRYGDTTDIAKDMRLTLHNAGHILGSSIAHFHIGDGLHNVAITGDIKFERTWLFSPAVNKFPRLETLVMESTYGNPHDFQPTRKEATRQLRQLIIRSLKKKGKVLIPVFAVGRSQEVMIVLEKLIRHKEIDRVPVYLDGMIMEATAIHTAYPEYLNNNLRNAIFQRSENPFLSDIFVHVASQQARENILHDPDPCIVLSTSGMLNGGPVMEYFKVWGPDSRNVLVFVGYQAENTLGRKIQRGWNEISMNERGRPIKVEVNMGIETCDGFSGHADRKQLISYVATLDPKPERIIIGHGEESKCLEFASSVYRKYNIETRAPMNLETIRFR